MTLTLSTELHRLLRLWFTHNPGSLATQRGYQSAYARAIRAVGGCVTGTHGARRRSIQDFYRSRYRQAVGLCMSTQEASELAAGDALERLGHSRDRADHRAWYLAK